MGILISLLVTGILVWLFALVFVPVALTVCAATAADNSPVLRFAISIFFALALVATIVGFNS